MRLFHVAMIVACGAALSGCGHVISRESFEARRQAMIVNPAAYQREHAECIEKSPRDPKQIEMLAQLVNQPANRTIQVICDRFTRAIHDGEISYEQYINQFKGVVDPRLIRISQDR